MKMEHLIEVYKMVNKFGRTMGMELKEVKEGEITYEMTITENHLATPTAAHGGSVAAMMDGVLGVAALSVTAKEQKLVATVEFKIHYLRPVKLNDVLTGKGRVVHKGNRIVICSGEIFNQNNEMVAMGTGTFNAYPFQKAGIKGL
ncbi:MAG: PaaI family thioesterase [Bacteroidetes bacterium]|nr:MAG: PaaI family thioesterase [Bacteroidota bacterium]